MSMLYKSKYFNHSWRCFMRRTTLSFLFTLFYLQIAFGNPTILEGKRLFKQAKTHRDKAQMLQAHAQFERLSISESDSWLAHYYVALTEYELCVYEMGSENLDLFSRYLNSAINHLDRTLQLKENWSEAQLLLSNLLGLKIYVYKLNGEYDQMQTLGIQSLEYAHLALEGDTSNPRAHLTMGIIKLNMPEEYGGSAESARQYIQKAIDLFASEELSDPLLPEWGYPQAYAWLGQIFEKLNKPQEALQTYQKALEIEPDNTWIKFDLLPKLTERLAAGK
jgi:tetratricopeptide (TPR) repeat protein